MNKCVIGLGRGVKHCVLSAALVVAFGGTGATVFSGEADVPLRDPTTPLNFVKHQSEQEPLVLQAVYQSGQRTEAIVNGKLVKEGDRVAGAKILRIQEKSVTYRRNGSAKTLYLRPNIMQSAP